MSQNENSTSQIDQAAKGKTEVDPTEPYSFKGSLKLLERREMIDPVVLDGHFDSFEAVAAGDIQFWFAEEENAITKLSPSAANSARKFDQEDLFQVYNMEQNPDSSLKEELESV